MAYHIYPI